jgi:probable HAF family extracellular repeat protein
MRGNWIAYGRVRQGTALTAFGLAAIGCRPDALVAPQPGALASNANAAQMTGVVRTDIIPATSSTMAGTVWGRAWAINEAGVVAGHRFVIPGPTTPPSSNVFLWKDGAFTLYPDNIIPIAINRRLEMAGNSIALLLPYDQFTSAPAGNRALYWKDGVVTDLGTLGGTASLATDINEKGQIVGVSRTQTGAHHAFIWEEGVMTDLGTLGGATSIAYSINSHGEAVGVSLTASGESHGFLWKKGSMTDLGVLERDYSGAYAINDRGEIAGRALATVPGCGSIPVVVPVVWRDGVPTRIALEAPINCFSTIHVHDISNSGHVVGTFNTTATRPWVWRDGVQVVLSGGGGDAAAFRINDSGETVGFGMQSVGFGAVALWSVGRHGP